MQYLRMKLAIFIILPLLLVVVGARHLSYSADPAIQCSDLRKSIQKTANQLKETEKELLAIRGKEDAVSKLKRQQFVYLFMQHVKYGLKYDEIRSTPEAKRKKECQVGAVITSYKQSDLIALGIDPNSLN